MRLGVKNLSGGVERCEASRRPTDRRGIPVGLRRDESRLDATRQPDIRSLEEKRRSGAIVGLFSRSAFGPEQRLQTVPRRDLGVPPFRTERFGGSVDTSHCNSDRVESGFRTSGPRNP